VVPLDNAKILSSLDLQFCTQNGSILSKVSEYTG